MNAPAPISIHIRVDHRDPGHVHFSVFVGKAHNLTHAKAGDLVLTPTEFTDIMGRLQPSRIDDPQGAPHERIRTEES